MNRKSFLFVLLAFALFHVAFADESWKINLNNESNRIDTVVLPFCKIYVTLQEIDYNDNAVVSVELENLSTNILCLFDRRYDERTLKKILYPNYLSIRYADVFGGSLGNRVTDQCANLTHSCYFKLYERKQIFQFTSDGSLTAYRIPIYIADINQKANKLKILEEKVVELQVSVNLTDKLYNDICRRYDTLVNDIRHETFCTNKRHQGRSYNQLKEVYEQKIHDLKKDIEAIQSSRQWFSIGKAYQKFQSIWNSLDTISIDDYKVSSCSNDTKTRVTPSHSCKYCALTYEEVYNRLEDYYIDIKNGDKSKTDVIADVTSLYKCVNENKKRGVDTNNFKERIETYYRDIINLP